MLFLLEFHLGGRPNLDEGDAACQLGQALLEFLAIPVGVGLVDLPLDLRDAALHGGGLAAALHNGGVVLGDHHLAGGTHHVEGHPV